MANQFPYDHLFKLLMIGDAGVGKVGFKHFSFMCLLLPRPDYLPVRLIDYNNILDVIALYIYRANPLRKIYDKEMVVISYFFGITQT